MHTALDFKGTFPLITVQALDGDGRCFWGRPDVAQDARPRTLRTIPPGCAQDAPDDGSSDPHYLCHVLLRPRSSWTINSERDWLALGGVPAIGSSVGRVR